MLRRGRDVKVEQLLLSRRNHRFAFLCKPAKVGRCPPALCEEPDIYLLPGYEDASSQQKVVEELWPEFEALE